MNVLICFAAISFVAGAAGRMSGQNDVQTGSSTNSGYLQTSKLVGRKVKSSEGKDIGVIKDIVFDRNTGCMAYTVLSTGGEGTGITSGGGKIVAIPWAVYSLTSDLSVLTVKVDRKKIFNAPAFEYTRLDEYARLDYIDNVYSYYGVSPGPRTAAAAGTDVTGTAGATASPGEVSSSAASENFSSTEKSSRRAHGSSAAPTYETSKENPSPKAIRSARAVRAQPSIDRGETTLSTTTEKSPTESATSPDKNKNPQRKTIDSTSRHRQRPTPESTYGED